MMDCYEVLKVNKGIIVQLGKDEAKINAYIKKCYDETVRKEVEIPKQVAISQGNEEELETLEQVQELCDEAYEIIGTAEGRAAYAETAEKNEKARFERIKNATTQGKFEQLKKKYNKAIEEAETIEKQKQEQTDKYIKFREKYQQRTKRSPYNILNIQRENFEKLSFKEKKETLKENKEILLKYVESLLDEKQNFVDRAEIHIRISEIVEAYDTLKLQLRETRYDHTKEYRPDLIKSIVDGNNQIENKVVIRQKNRDTANEKLVNKNMSNREHHIADKERRNLRVKTIAKIGYQNIEGEKNWVYEYQVTRKVDGKDEVARVVSPMSIAEILLDKKIGKEKAIELYNYLANELFSEERIKGAQKNGGFIGSIKQDEEGNYYLTLDEDELDSKEQEMLAATMICREKEKQKQEEERE